MINEKAIHDLNKKAAQLAQKSNHDRNYIHLFRPHDNNKLNIVGSFLDSIKKENPDVTDEDNPDDIPVLVDEFSIYSKNSFGMVARAKVGENDRSVLLDFPDYRDIAIDKGPMENFYRSLQAFEKELENADKMFCIDKSNNERDHPKGYKYTYEQYRKALYARCLVANIWCFGIDFVNLNSVLYAELKKSKQVFILEKPDGITRVYGRPTDDLINQLGDVECMLASSLSRVTIKFADVYTSKNAIIFNSDNIALYSGVIPRLKSISYEPPAVGNSKINKLTTSLGRTSYMTMHGLHFTINGKYRDELLQHPFLTQISCDGSDVSLADINIEFEQHEMELQLDVKKKLEDAKTFLDEIDVINNYLKNSFNVHNINISGNIITEDGYCLYTKRSDDMTDANQFYCSVNGGCEINDSSVKYYHNSMQDDIPTISYSTEPVYFGGELTRESIAELGENDISPYWNYYGITCMSHMTEDQLKDSNNLYMHFNILGERQSPYTLSQISAMRMNANEKFENKSLHGYSIIPYYKRSEYVAELIIKGAQFIQDNSDFLIAVLMFIQIIKTKHLNDSVGNTIFTFFLALVAIIIFINRLVLFVKSRKQYREIIVKTYNHFSIKTYKKSYISAFNEEFKEKLKAGNDIDSIFYVLTNMHVLSTVQEDL